MNAILVFIGATLLIAISPGANTFFVISQALSVGFRRSFLAIFGLALSSLAYLTLTITGLSALLFANPVLFTAIRVAGAGYLIYLGARMIAGAGRRRSETAPHAESKAPVLQGFLTSFSNPKGILYWSAFLPQFVDRAQPVVPQLLLFGLIGTMVEVVVLACYAWLAARSRERLAPARFAATIDRAAGAYFIVMGLSFGWLLFKRRA